MLVLSLNSLSEHCYDNMSLDTHSFRIGGASLAAQAGVASSVIRKIGRWKSTCFLKYIKNTRGSAQDGGGVKEVDV